MNFFLFVSLLLHEFYTWRITFGVFEKSLLIARWTHLTFFSLGDHWMSSTDSEWARYGRWSTCQTPPSLSFHRWMCFLQSPERREPRGKKKLNVIKRTFSEIGTQIFYTLISTAISTYITRDANLLRKKNIFWLEKQYLSFCFHRSVDKVSLEERKKIWGILPKIISICSLKKSTKYCKKRNSWYLCITHHWNWINCYWMFWIGCPSCAVQSAVCMII